MNDTIAAIATSLGIGAISIIRVSGSKAIPIVNSIFERKDLNKVSDHTINYGYIVDNNVKIGTIIDKDMENCNVYSDDNNTMIAVVGTKGLNIIKSNNVILIANKDKMEEIPNLIVKIREDKKLKKYI